MEGTKTCGTCVVHMYAAKVSGMVDDDDGWSLVVEVVVVVVVVVFLLSSLSCSWYRIFRGGLVGLHSPFFVELDYFRHRRRRWLGPRKRKKCLSSRQTPFFLY